MPNIKPEDFIPESSLKSKKLEGLRPNDVKKDNFNKTEILISAIWK